MEQEPRNDQSTEQVEPTVSRRALIKAGWVIPAVMVTGIPKDALAMNGSDYSGDHDDDDDDHDYDWNHNWNYSWSSWYTSFKRWWSNWSWWGW